MIGQSQRLGPRLDPGGIALLSLALPVAVVGAVGLVVVLLVSGPAIATTLTRLPGPR